MNSFVWLQEMQELIEPEWEWNKLGGKSTKLKFIAQSTNQIELNGLKKFNPINEIDGFVDGMN